jgi:hypothetical protein
VTLGVMTFLPVFKTGYFVVGRRQQEKLDYKFAFSVRKYINSELEFA